MLWGGNMSNEIIINRMFSGNYLENEDNIGHEIINLYKDDNGNNYIYLLAGGDYKQDHANNEIDGILLVRGISANCVEVLAKATIDTNTEYKVFNPIDEAITKENGKTKPHWKNGWSGTNVKEMRAMGQAIYNKEGNDFDKACKNAKIIKYREVKNKGSNTKGVKEYTIKLGDKIKRFKDIHDKQIKYIQENKITYDSVPLDKLYGKNNTEYGLSIYITYKVEKVQKVKEPFYLYINEKDKNKFTKITENDTELSRKRLSGSAGATFYPNDSENDNDKNDYEKLKGILENDNLWGEETECYKDIVQTKIDDDFTFLSLIKKEYDELAFSNMFAHYFKKNNNILNGILSKSKNYSNKNVSQPFLQTKVEINNPKTSQKEDTENDKNKNDQTKRITREEKNIDILIDDVQSSTVIVIENKIKSELNGRHSTDSILNQLDKYYDYTEKEYASYKNKVYLLLVPNYSRITEDSLVSEKQKKFDIIHYKDLYDILKENNIEDKYYDDFINAVKFHSNDIDNHFEDIMKRKMQKLINESK